MVELPYMRVRHLAVPASTHRCQLLAAVKTEQTALLERKLVD